MMYLHIDKDKVKDQLLKRIANNEIFIDLYEKVRKGAEKIKHHKQVTKKIEAAIDADVYLNREYSTRLNIYIPHDQRTWKKEYNEKTDYWNHDQFERIDESIYFKDYESLIDNAKLRMSALKVDNKKIKDEIADLDRILKEATVIEDAIKTFEDERSGALKQAINWK